MSSNVLKSLSDCYNFDDNNDSKTKSKRKQRLRTNSSTSKSSKAKSKTLEVKDELKSGNGIRVEQKWRCNAIKDILKSSVWLNDIRADSRSAIDSVLELLFKHITDDCNCVNLCSTNLLIGNTYFERFLFNLKQFENKVVNEENIYSEPTTTGASIKSQNNAINDIPINKESKLESNVMLDLVNLSHMSALLAPLEEAVSHWNKGFDLSLKSKVLTEDAIHSLKIYYNLSSVIQINAFYNRIESQLKASELLNKFCRYYSSKYSEISLTANYYLVKTYIQLGALNKALTCLTPILPSSASTKDKQMPETYGKSLNLLAKCELDLLMGRSEKAAKSLKCFLNSEYLQKLTINRYYIKGLSLLMASKFNSKHFDYSNSFQEFLEPIQMSICILKRWHPWLSSSAKPNNENLSVNAGDLDPIWYKFAVLNFAFEAMQLSAGFCANIGMPIDSFFYYNCLIKLGRRYCATVPISKLLIIGSQLDVICDHKHSALTKLANALMCLQSLPLSSDSVSVFDSSPIASSISPDTRRAIDVSNHSHSRRRSLSSDSELEIIEVRPTHSSTNYDPLDDCQHKQSSSVWELKKKLRKLENQYNSSDSEDSIVERDRTSTNGSISDEINCSYNEILDLFFIRIEIKFFILLFNDNESKYALTQIKRFYNNFIQSFALNLLKERMSQILSGYYLENLFENYSYYKSLKSKIIETIARLEVENKEFEEAIHTCHEISRSKAFTYAERVIHSNLLYFEAFSKLNLYKTKHNITEDKVWIEYNNNLMESVSNLWSGADQPLSPLRALNQMKAFVPKAPKHKQFKNDEIQEYVTALENCVYEESKASSSKSTTDRNPFRLKTNSKLNFENDSELRSYSVTDLMNDKPMDANLIVANVSSKPNPKSKPTERMTRSRASSLKVKIDISGNEEKLVKLSKRLSSKSSKTKTSSEVTDIGIDFNKEFEELDEVFEQTLVINDVIEAEEKVSKDCDYDLHSMIQILKRGFDLVSSHPGFKLYVLVNKLLTQIYSLQENVNEDIVGYHYSESNASTYRYRNLFIAEKKRKLNRISKYDLQSIVFNRKNIELNNSFKSFIDGLPTDWRIIQILAVSNDSKIPELMVCRFQNGKRPVFLKLNSNSEKIIKDFMTQFKEIIERSNASIINKDRETFWRLRYSLDEELMVLLRSVEETWFGPFRGILFGQLQSKSYQKMCQLLTSYVIDSASHENLVCVSPALLEVVVESLPSLKYMEFRAAMKLLFKSPSNSLISNCFAKYEDMFCEVFPIDNKESIFTTYAISPIGLILDNSLESFPFESLPTLQSYSQSIFRTPSLRILSLMYKTFEHKVEVKGVDDSSVYYVVNPADNLAKTEEFFRNTFVSMKDWVGVIGKAPEPLDLQSAFASRDAYIFFGHGAGASYYRAMPDGLDGCTINCASLVMGCSSGKLFSEGKQLESFGTPYRFLMNGSPCFVGVLWDVTDKDIDKFSDHLLSYWFANWKPDLNETNDTQMPITKAVSMARKFCRLKHLIGAAPVVYGLPLVTKTMNSS